MSNDIIVCSSPQGEMLKVKTWMIRLLSDALIADLKSTNMSPIFVLSLLVRCGTRPQAPKNIHLLPQKEWRSYDDTLYWIFGV